MFGLSTKSAKKLEGVHPDLVAVVKRAIEITDIDFGVSEGLRSYERQYILVQEKKSKTLHSLHLLQGSGYGHAVDIFAYINGKAQWQNKYSGPIVQAFFTAAIALDPQLKAGHLGKHFSYSVHIHLSSEHST